MGYSTKVENTIWVSYGSEYGYTNKLLVRGVSGPKRKRVNGEYKVLGSFRDGHNQGRDTGINRHNSDNIVGSRLSADGSIKDAEVNDKNIETGILIG